MGHLCFDLKGRFFAGVTAAVLLAAVSSPAAAFGDKGVIDLLLPGTSGQFVYTDGNGGPSVSQGFYEAGKGSCLLSWASTSVHIVELTASGPSEANGLPGMASTSIGAWDGGSKGTACSRVSGDEWLTFAIGKDALDAGANAFDRLQLDVEVKSSADIILTVKLGESTTGVFELRSGSSVVSGQGGDVSSDPDHPIFNCNALSDSGPDAGSADNCTWIIENVLGNSFTLSAKYGEFSLEGGGDWGTEALAKDTKIWLTHAVEGELACGGTTDTIPIGGDSSTMCNVTRSMNDSSCSIVPKYHYFLRGVDTGNENGCEFIKASGSAQIAGEMHITFKPEARTELNSVPPTTVLFPLTNGGYQNFQPALCQGTVVDEYKDVSTTSTPDWLFFGQTIGEVLGVPVNGTVAGLQADPDGITAAPTTLPGFVDQDPANNPIVDWACVLEQSVAYKGPFATPQMQVTQTILFWGDPAVIRF